MTAGRPGRIQVSPHESDPREPFNRSLEPIMSVIHTGKPPTSPRQGRVGVAVAALAVMQFVLVLDSAIINVALATIANDLAAPADHLTWVVNAYALAFGGLLLLGGRLADLTGARRLFVLGTALFGLASLAGAFAPTVSWLITSRAAQGAGAAMAAPAALALLVDLFPDGAQRSKAIGLFGVMAGAGGSAGLLLGGILTQTLGWRSVLWINVPVVAAVLVAAVTLPVASLSVGRKALDIPGALTATAGISLLVYALIEAPTRGWVSAPTLSVLAATGLMFVAFARIESTAIAPLLPRALGRAAGLTSANVAVALMMAAMFPMWFLLTLYLQQDLGRSPVGAGLSVLPLSLTMMATNSITPHAVARFGPRAVMTSGLLLAAAGLAGLAAVVAAQGEQLALIVPSIAAGLGFGLAFVAGVIAATAPAPPDEAGTASGLVNTSQQVGGALGLAALLSLVVALAGTAPPGAEDYAAALLGGAAIALSASAVSALGLRAHSIYPSAPTHHTGEAPTRARTGKNAATPPV